MNLTREKLFDSIIRNIQKRLMDSNHLLTRKNDEGSNLVHELIHLVEPHSWNIELRNMFNEEQLNAQTFTLFKRGEIDTK